MREMERSGAIRPYTGRLPRDSISEREAGSGTTWRALRGGRSGKKQCYDLARVVGPDPPPNENRGSGTT